MLCIGGWIRELGSLKNNLGALYVVPVNVVDALTRNEQSSKR